MNTFWEKYKRLIILLAMFALGCMIYVTIDKLEHQLINNSYQEVDLSVCGKETQEDGEIRLTIPAEYVYGATQEQLDATARKSGFTSVTLQENGTAVYVMTASKYDEMLLELAKGLDQTIASLPGSEKYGEVTDIIASEDYTHYLVHLSTNGIGFDATESLAQFRSLASAYSAFLGKTSCEVSVSYIDVNGKEIISY